jgi:hypothetical protein
MSLIGARLLHLGLALLVGMGLVGGAAVGCGDIDGGNEPFAGTARYQDPMGSFELRLLEPPWLPVTLSGQLVFVVPPNAVLSSTLKESDMLYSLHVIGVGGDPESALAAAMAANPSVTVTNQRKVTAVSGASGVEVAWQEAPTVYHREAFLGTAGGPTFFLHFTAKGPIGDDAMITQMVISFAPRGTIVPGASR